MNHFVPRFRGMMENDEAVQRVDNDMILVVFNFCWKEFIDLFATPHTKLYRQILYKVNFRQVYIIYSRYNIHKA